MGDEPREAETTGVSRPAGRESYKLGGIEARILVSGETTGGRFGVVEAPILPKVLAGPLHVHHREDACWYVLEGDFAAQVGEREFNESAGALVYAPRGVPHTYWNPSDEPALYLEMFWPAGVEAYLATLGTILASVPDDILERVGTLSAGYGIEMDWDSATRLIERHGLRFAGDD